MTKTKIYYSIIDWFVCPVSNILNDFSCYWNLNDRSWMFFCLRNTHRQKTILSEFLSRVVINMYIYLLIIIVTATKLFHVSVHAYHLQRITKGSDYLIYVVHVTCYQFLYSVFCFVQLLLIRFPLILPYFDPA